MSTKCACAPSLPHEIGCEVFFDAPAAYLHDVNDPPNNEVPRYWHQGFALVGGGQPNWEVLAGGKTCWLPGPPSSPVVGPPWAVGGGGQLGTAGLSRKDIHTHIYVYIQVRVCIHAYPHMCVCIGMVCIVKNGVQRGSMRSTFFFKDFFGGVPFGIFRRNIPTRLDVASSAGFGFHSGPA